MLSVYQLEITIKHKLSLDETKKLIPNLGDKKHDKLHYKNVQLYLRLELQFIKQIHRALEFKQSKWLKPYIKRKTQLRKQAKKKKAEKKKVAISKNKLPN